MASVGMAGRASMDDGYVFNPVTGTFEKRAKPTSPLENQYKIYEQAIQKQAGDYDSIMGDYKTALSKSLNEQDFVPKTYSPQLQTYQEDPRLTNAVSNLQGLSETGGYSDADKDNIRARGLSPIRAVYQNSLREMERRNRLAGSPSANYNAARAKMAREQSGILADKTTDLEAGIAEKVAANKMNIAPQWAAFIQNQSNLQNQIQSQNTDRTNEANKFNIEAPMQAAAINNQKKSTALGALSGMTNLYGTQPALAATYGQQAQNATNVRNQQRNRQMETGMDYLNSVMGRY